MFELDTGQKGFRMFFKDWHVKVLEYLWSHQAPEANSKEVWIGVNKNMHEPLSRTSVILFLKDMANKGIIIEEMKAGRGGYRGIYSHKYSEKELKQHLSEHIIEKLLEEFPEEAGKVIEKQQQKRS